MQKNEYIYVHKRPWKAPPFPHIIDIKLMKLVNIFMSPKIMQKRIKLYVFALETSGKRSFPFSLLLSGKCINQKNLNVKTLSRPNTKRTHQRAHSKLCHLDMPWTQTHSVKLSIFCQLLYTSVKTRGDIIPNMGNITRFAKNMSNSIDLGFLSFKLPIPTGYIWDHISKWNA